MLHAAAERMRNAGHHVCAAYLSPSHDAYVGPKAKSLGTLGLSAALRLELARRTVAEDSLVAVSSWEATYQGHWPDFPVVCKALQLEATVAALGAQVFYVCGTDHAKKCGLTRGGRPFGVVIVPRAGETPPAERVSARVLVAAPAEGDAAAFSSTLLRAALRKHEEATVAAMTTPAAAALLLRPSAAEHSAFSDDYAKLGIAEPSG